MDAPTESKKADAPDSFTSQMKTDGSSFLGETSLHGIKHVGDKTRSKFRRCIWLLLILGMSVWLIYTLYSLYTRYKSYPYTTHSTVIPKAHLPLPAISLCLRHSIQRSRLRQLPNGDVIKGFLERFLEPSDLKEMLNNETVRAALSSVTMQDLMNVGSFRAEEVIKYAYVYLGALPTAFFDSKHFYTFDSFIGVSGLPTRCFTFNTTTRSGADGVVFLSELHEWAVILQPPMTDLIPGNDDTGGVFVSIHPPWQPPSSIQTINIQPNSAVDIMLSPSEYHFLPAPYLSMDNKDCEDTNSPDYVSHMRYLSRYSYGNCLTEKSVLAAVEVCNCTSQSLGTKILSLLTECKNPCVIERMETKSASVSPFPSQNYIQTLPQEELDGMNLENLLRVNVKFANTYLGIMKHKPELTFDSIYSIIGGQMGLFLGASLLTVTELAEHLLCLMWASLKRLLGNKNLRARSSVDSNRLSN